MKRFLKSFVYAAEGIICGFRERNFRFHICAALLTSAFAVKFYKLSRAEWAVLFLTFAAVISAELFNTSIERLCDKVSPERDEHIRRSKDTAAGAVLVSAIFSAFVGIALFGDIERLKAIGEYFVASPARLLLWVIAVTVAALFVFMPEKKKKK